jgi:hypothetical protein
MKLHGQSAAYTYRAALAAGQCLVSRVHSPALPAGSSFPLLESLVRAASPTKASKDVLVTPGTPISHAAQRATSSVPIVMASGDAVGAGLCRVWHDPAPTSPASRCVPVITAPYGWNSFREVAPIIQTMRQSHGRSSAARSVALDLAILALAARHRLPATFSDRVFVASGG